MAKISKTHHVTRRGVVKKNPARANSVPATINTADGQAGYVTTEVENKMGHWNDNYYISDGYYVIHQGKEHHVYLVGHAPRIQTIDITKQVGELLEKKGFGDDSNKETDIKKAGIWNLMDALAGKDNSKFTADEAKAELKRRGV